MEKKIGRPTNDPKIHERKIRFSNEDEKKINFCCEVLGLKKSEVVRRGISELYDRALKLQRETPAHP